MTLDEIVQIAMYVPASTFKAHPHDLVYMGTREYKGDVYNIYRNDDIEKENEKEVTYSKRYYIVSHWDLKITEEMEEIHKDLIRAGLIRPDRRRKKQE